MEEEELLAGGGGGGGDTFLLGGGGVRPTIHQAEEADRAPCCAITEGGWTWFCSILLTLALFALFHLKYKKKVLSRPKNLQKQKNTQVLKGYLLAQQKAARTEMPEGDLTLAEFERCCEERRRHPIIFKIEYGTAVAGLARAEAGAGEQGAARSEENLPRNRTKEIVPHDTNRVVLRQTGRGDTDYINASHIRGLVPGRNYIVTQVQAPSLSANTIKIMQMILIRAPWTRQ